MPVEGVQACLKAMGKARVDDSIAIDEGLRKCAEILLRAAQKLVPIDTGALRESGKIVSNGKKGMGAQYDVLYDTYYAFFVHEDLEAKHNPPTQAKWLSTALKSVRGTMTAVLQRQLNVSVGRK